MNFQVQDWGKLGYQDAWDRQLEIHQMVRDGGPDTLVFVEHPAVYTLGASFHSENLIHPEAWYAEQGIEIIRTDRGGDITYHGPNQLVIYPIFDLNRHGRGLHPWVRNLEQVILNVASQFGLEPRLFPPHTGVWVGDRKLAAIGIKIKKWISLHGIALNCSNDLSPFGWIIPCGIADYGVTSLSQETGRLVTPDEAKPKVIAAFQDVFSPRSI